MSELTELTLCVVAVISIAAPPFCWYVDRFLDATRAHVVDISKTAEAEK